MPNITTHIYFARDILTKVNPLLKSNLINNQKLYELASLGTDPFIFYEFFKPHKKNLQGIFHTKETDTFFLEYIEKVKEKKLINNINVTNFLYGMLAHYVMDSTMHPYIVYKSGRYDKFKPETKKYIGLHNKIEMELDAYLFELKNQMPFKNFKIHNLITKEIDKEIVKLLNLLYYKIYNVKNGGRKYKHGVNIMYLSYKYIIEDKWGLKKKLYCFIDKIIPNKGNKFAYFNSHVTKIDADYLNNNHQKWLNPWDKSISTKSFSELYDEALNTAINLFEATNDYLNDLITKKQYMRILKDKSYLTGLPWHKELPLKYLEF